MQQLVDADLDQDVNLLWTLLFEVITEAEKRMAGYMAAHHLTPPQFFVLKTLVEHSGRCPIGQIAREHHLTNATLTGLVKRLEVMQPPLVARERSDADRRSVTVVLTPAGYKRFKAVQEGFIQQLRLILSLLSSEERQDILEKITRYVTLLMQHFPLDPLQVE